MIDNITGLLQSGGFGTENVDIFSAAQPDDPDDCVTVYETGGFKPELHNSVEYPTFQIIVRGKIYATARQKVDDIYKALHGNTSIFMLIQAMQSPGSLGQDQKKRWEFSVNFKIIKHM